MSFCVRCFDNDTDEPKDLRKVLRLLVLSLCDNAGSSSLVAAFRTEQQQLSVSQPTHQRKGSILSSSGPPNLPMTPPRPGSSSSSHFHNKSTGSLRRPRRTPPSLGTLQHVLFRTFQSPIESIPLGVAQPAAAAASSTNSKGTYAASNSSSTNSSLAGMPSSAVSSPLTPQVQRKKWVRFTDVGRVGRKMLRRLAVYYAPPSTSVGAATDEWSPEQDPEAQYLLTALRECQGLIVVVDSTVPLTERSNSTMEERCNGERFFTDFDGQRQSQQEELTALLSLLQNIPSAVTAKTSKNGKKKQQLLRDEQQAAEGPIRRPVPPLFIVANKQDQPGAIRLSEIVPSLALTTTSERTSNSLKGILGRWTCQPASVLLQPHHIMTRIMRFFSFGLGAVASGEVYSMPVSPGGLSDSTTSRRRVAQQKNDTHSGTDISPPPLSFRAILSDDERTVTTATNSTTSTIRASRFASLLAPPPPPHHERGGVPSRRPHSDTNTIAPHPRSRSPSTMSRLSDSTDKPVEMDEVPLRSSSHHHHSSVAHKDPLIDTNGNSPPDRVCDSTSEQRSLLGREGSGATMIKHSVQRALASKLKMSPTTAPLESPQGGQYEPI